MVAFTIGDVVTISLVVGNQITTTGNARVVITPATGPVWEENITGTQILGPYLVAVTLVLNCSQAGSYTISQAPGQTFQGPINQNYQGLTRSLTPVGGGLVREYVDIPNAATVGGIEIASVYNCAINPTTGVWQGRDIADICWFEKWSDTLGLKEIWSAPSASAGVVPTWSRAISIDAINQLLTAGSGPTGLIFRQWAGGQYGAIYSTAVTPNAGNHGFMTNGMYSYINGTSASFLWVNGLPILTATSTGVAVTGALSSTAPATLSGGYTVATLPTGTIGQRAYVTDATAPTYLGALTGGGAVKCPVFHNGTAWVSA